MFCKLVLPSNEVHKISSVPASYEELRDLILKKFPDEVPKDFTLKYKDSDDELISIINTEDLTTAITTTESEQKKVLRIFIIPPQEPTCQSRPTLKFDPLPGIPEAIEQSRSSIAELSRMPSGIGDQQKQTDESMSSSYIKFDLDRIPRTQSVILDEDESISGMNTPFPDKSDAFKNKRFFTFSRANSIEISKNQQEGNLTNGFLNEQKIKLIENLIDTRISQKLQESVQTIVHELAMKFCEECSYLNSTGAPVYQSGYFSRSVNRPMVRRHTIQAPRNYPKSEPLCACCSKIISGIKYYCLTCPSYVCCETCEGQESHIHPLLKIRPPKKNGENKENTPNINESESPFNGLGNPFVVRGAGRHSTMNLPLMSISSVVNLPDVDSFDSYNTFPNVKPTDLTMPARRGFSMGNILGGGMPMQGKLGRKPCENECKYKASITKSLSSEVVTVKPGNSFRVCVTVKNTGDIKWPDLVKLVCINGYYKEKDVDVKSLKPGEEKIVPVSLVAPGSYGKYLSQWKLQYYEDELPRQFGKAIFIDVEVNDRDKQFKDEPLEEKEENEESEEKTHRRMETPSKQKKFCVFETNSEEPDKHLMKEMKCCKEVLGNAKALNDMFPGDLKEKIEFIKNSESHNINDIVSSYLAKMSNVIRSNKKSMTWANGHSISTQS